ncbi:MAG: VWA domain-containing protein [Pseudomonadota bacterium]
MKSSGEICVRPPEDRLKVSKVLFIVDKSGSKLNGGGVAGEGNDPDDVRRADNIQSFLDRNRGTPFQEYGYIAFGVDTNRAEAYINDGDLGSPIFSDEEALQDAIDLHRAEPDDGCTPYLTALSLAELAIENDIDSNPNEDATYNIFFLSDGFPNDANAAQNCGSTTAVTDEPTDPYLRAVQDIVDIAPDRIFLSTAYYATPENDPGRAAARGLSYMAQAGQGTFTDLLDSDVLEFNQIRTGQTPEAWMIKQMSAVNLNAAFCMNGTLGADSDSDGLCDRDEVEINQTFASRFEGLERFDPRNRNSLGSDYSDYFYYKFEILPTGEGLLTCNIQEADQDFDFLNTCEENVLTDVSANGPTPQWTEAMQRTASSVNPDSDGDGFLDSFEYFQFGIKSVAVDYTNLFDRYSAGISGATLLAERRHPMRPNYRAPDATNLKVKFDGINSQGQNCYDVKLEKVALFPTQAVESANVSGLSALTHGKDENVIMLYYIAVPERDPNGTGYLFYKFKKVKSLADIEPSFPFTNYNAYKVPRLDSRGN